MFEKLKKRYRYSAILIRELVITDFKLRYQGSFLGYLWSLLKPLFLFAILYTIFTLVLKIGKGVEHWSVALLLGLVLWNYFSEITNGGMKSIAGRSGLIKKINFPKYVIIFAGAASATINLLLNSVIIVVFLLVNRVEFTPSMFVGLLFIIEILIFSVGLSFFLSALFIKFRDIQYIWEIIMRGGFYASAIFFPISRIIAESNETVAQVLLMNPIGQSIQDARHFIVSDSMPTLYTISDSIALAAVPIIVSFAVFALGALYFRSKSPYFAEES